jgi:Tfp pilus assembly protein PilF
MTQLPIDQSFYLALQRQQAGKLREAEEIYREILAREPGHAGALVSLGVIARKTGRTDLAVELFRRAIAAKPGFAEAYSNLGNALKDAGRFDEAISAYRQAIQFNPGLPEVHNNLGNSLKDQGQLNEAIAEYRRAISLRADYANAHVNLAMGLLLSGEFEEGWREYEWRLRMPGAVAPGRDIFQRLWDGGDLAGRTILLHSEQGFGDAIQFSRYIPKVLERGGRVIVQVQKDLIRSLRQIRGVEKWIAKGEGTVEFDLQCPLLSLPGLFGTRLENIPVQKDWLVAEPDLAQNWRGRMEKESGQLKVGLAWAGSPTHKKDRSRSIPLSFFAPLTISPRISLYSLQKGKAAREVSHPPAGTRIIDWTDELHDFADTAGLVANLDLVISVDTAVAHLAAAMGKPVWLLLPFIPDWRWMLGRNDSPWHPTMRLFRQQTRGDWRSVIGGVAEELSALAAGSRLR